ncbi:MAG: hypothetical protein U0531_08525 [Dehalococcoidia bacterium]
MLVGAIIITAALFAYFLLKVGDEDAPRPPSQPGYAKKGWLGWLKALLAVTILPSGLGFLAEGVNATTAIALLCAAPAVVVIAGSVGACRPEGAPQRWGCAA